MNRLLNIPEIRTFLKFCKHNKVIAMSSRNHNNNSVPFVKIVYSTVKINGKIELVPMEWYADGSVKKNQR
ncbi:MULTISPECIES: hypothetical protein [unclassified Microcoleus]|uniref:hypothetical protein n=1 Tax=unclassified Microcoleus TaxID=2642155 RepID=UPI002FCF9BA6